MRQERKGSGGRTGRTNWPEMDDGIGAAPRARALRAGLPSTGRCRSVEGRLVVIVDTAIPGPVIPIEVRVRYCDSRRALEHLLVEVHEVAALVGIILQYGPRQRVVPIADAEK